MPTDGMARADLWAKKGSAVALVKGDYRLTTMSSLHPIALARAYLDPPRRRLIVLVEASETGAFLQVYSLEALRTLLK